MKTAGGTKNIILGPAQFPTFLRFLMPPKQLHAGSQPAALGLGLLPTVAGQFAPQPPAPFSQATETRETLSKKTRIAGKKKLLYYELRKIFKSE